MVSFEIYELETLGEKDADWWFLGDDLVCVVALMEVGVISGCNMHTCISTICWY